MADVKQWINLDPGTNHRTAAGVSETLNEPKVRCGPVLKLRAKITTSGKKDGRRVFWGVQTDSKNIYQLSQASGPQGKNKWKWQSKQGGFGAPGFHERLSPTNKKGESNVTFHLADAAGGDKFTIKAYTKDSKGNVKKELKSDTFIVWRQLFYEVTRMRGHNGKTNLPAIGNIPWGDVKGEFDDSRKPHNIRWTEVPASVAMITRHPSLWKDDMVKATGLEGYNRTYEPMVLKVSLVDMMADLDQEDHMFTVSKPNREYPYKLNKCLLDRNSPDDRDDWLRYCQAWRTDDPSQSVNVQKTDFRKTGPGEIAVTLAAIPKLSTFDFCRKATVRVGVWLHDGYLGLSWYNGIWVIDRCPSGGQTPSVHAHTAANKVDTMVHEWGHAIGMVPTGSPFQYGTDPNAGTALQKHHHVGSHCYNGASGNPNTVGLSSPTGAICVMFGDNSSNTKLFCDECVKWVRSVKPASDGSFNTGSMMPASIAAW